MKAVIVVSRIIDNSTLRSKVSAIKALRAYTGLSLKDSKDAIEEVYDTGKDLTFPISEKFEYDYNRINDFRSWALSGGIKIDLQPVDTPQRREIATMLNDVLAYATLCSEFDVVNSLNKILKIQLPEVDKEEKC